MATTTVSASSRSSPDDSATELGGAFASGSTPHLTGQPARRGRPPVAEPRPKVTIRLPKKTLEALRQSGRGWQTRLARLAGEMVASETAAEAASSPSMMQAAPAMASEGEAAG